MRKVGTTEPLSSKEEHERYGIEYVPYSWTQIVIFDPDEVHDRVCTDSFELRIGEEIKPGVHRVSAYLSHAEGGVAIGVSPVGDVFDYEPVLPTGIRRLPNGAGTVRVVEVIAIVPSSENVEVALRGTSDRRSTVLVKESTVAEVEEALWGWP